LKQISGQWNRTDTATRLKAAGVVLMLSVPVLAQTGDVPDGSRTRYVHVIPLYPEDRDGDKGFKITPGQTNPMPFSMRWSCGNCHDYDKVAKGFHFNSTDPNVQPGRLAQPWIYAEASLAVQVPLSYRPWPGVYRPDQFGISPFEFVRHFGRHMPGVGPGEAYAKDTNNAGQARLSGRLEVNCLTCHNADPGQDQGGAFGFADQAREGNFRWAATASVEFANVRGSVRNVAPNYDPYVGVTGPIDTNSPPPFTWYQRDAFDDNNDVFLDLTGKVPNERCYYCHSNALVGSTEGNEVLADEDIHMAAGMRCVDCHRNGIDHAIVRGYPGQFNDPNHAWAGRLTCEGCHLDDPLAVEPTAGRMRSPVPEHKGVPSIHFEKLACTACHSGPWPQGQAGLVKTSRAHALGTTYAEKADRALPHIIYPVFAKQADGKIAPHKMIWPAFWATLTPGSQKPEARSQNGGGEVLPIQLSIIEPIAKKVIKRGMATKTNDWPPLTDEMVVQILKSLAKQVGGQPVYICGGQMHYVDDKGRLAATEHPVAAPLLWSAAHEVRPARQALGVRRCEDCHNVGSPFFFGTAQVDTPIVSRQGAYKPMSDFEGIDVQRTKVFAWTFVFRPWLKVVGLLSCGVVAIATLLITGVGIVLHALIARGPKPRTTGGPSTGLFVRLIRMATAVGVGISILGLAISGLYGRLVLDAALSGYLLLAHVTLGGVFVVALAVFAVVWSSDHWHLLGQWGRNVVFGLMLILNIPLVLAIILNMFPVFGTDWQGLLRDVHLYSGLGCTICGAIWGYLTIRRVKA